MCSQDGIAETLTSLLFGDRVGGYDYVYFFICI